MKRTTRLPSIGTRVLRALAGWSALTVVAVSGVVWLAVQQKVVELLDATLRASAEALLVPLAQQADGDPVKGGPALPQASGRFAWQVVSHEPGGVARVLRGSSGAPADPLHATPTAGFSDVNDWRVFGAPLGHDAQMLYVAQTLDERLEAQLEVALSGALATLVVALLAHLWLRARLRHELAPLQALAQQLSTHDPLEAGSRMGAAEREELVPVHAAIDALAERLARRLAHERAFTAHAAHALRTPLAGIDAQLAVALREAPQALQPRLQRVRSAAGRLQRVVAALLALFRSGAELNRQPVDLAGLVARLPVPGLSIQVDATLPVRADVDLVTAALLNLFDNAQRHGAAKLHLSTPAPDVLRLHDDGPGVDAAQRQALQRGIDAPEGDDSTGLGLMLAGLVARAHGGEVRLPAVLLGFAVELRLRAAPDAATPTTPA